MFAIEQSTEIAHRCDFSLLCNVRGLTGVAIEVGVDQGVNARDFLSRWSGNWLIGIDPYWPIPDFGWIDRQTDMMTAIQALMPYHGRFRLIRATSLDFASHYPYWLGAPGFVYVDGDHTYQAVADDLRAWWDRLIPEGILAGHDYHNEDHPEVKAAVDDFARERGLVVRITREAGMPSFYIYKTEPEMLVHRFFDSQDPSPNPHVSPLPR